jgi:hypothetical protein
MTSPLAVMVAIAQPGGVARVRAANDDAAKVLGEPNAMALATATVTRSTDVATRVQRVAAGLAKRYKTTAPRAARRVEMKEIPGLLDAWFAAEVIRRGTAKKGRTEAGTIRNDIGAVVAAIDRAFPGRTPTWDRVKEARVSTGIDLGKGERGSRVEVPPWIPLYWADKIGKSPVAWTPEWRGAAALVLAALNGMAVGTVRHIKPENLEILSVKGRGQRFGYTVSIPPTAPLKVRKRLAEGSGDRHPTAWTAGADHAVTTVLSRWHALARERGWVYLFPADMSSKKGEIPIPARTLNAVLAVAAPALPGRTWHGCRYGNSRALDMMMPGVAEKVKNVIQLRSNAKVTGSRHTYTKDKLDDIFDASMKLRDVRWTASGPFMRDIPDGDDSVQGVSDDDDSDTSAGGSNEDTETESEVDNKSDNPPPRKVRRAGGRSCRSRKK